MAPNGTEGWWVTDRRVVSSRIEYGGMVRWQIPTFEELQT